MVLRNEMFLVCYYDADDNFLNQVKLLYIPLDVYDDDLDDDVDRDRSTFKDV